MLMDTYINSCKLWEPKQETAIDNIPYIFMAFCSLWSAFTSLPYLKFKIKHRKHSGWILSSLLKMRE